MLWFSGLRGAMAFALSVRNTASEAREMFFTTTCLIAIITVVFVGGLTPPVIELLRIPTTRDDEDNDEERERLLSSCGSSDRSFLARAFTDFDVRFLKPALTNGTNPTLMESTPECCLPMAQCLSTRQQIMASNNNQTE